MGNKDISSFGISDMADFVVDLISKQVYEPVLKKVERQELKECKIVNVDELKRGKAVAGTFEPVEVKKVGRAFVPSEIQQGRAVEVNEGVAIKEKPKLETVDAKGAVKKEKSIVVKKGNTKAGAETAAVEQAKEKAVKMAEGGVRHREEERAEAAAVETVVEDVHEKRCEEKKIGSHRRVKVNETGTEAQREVRAGAEIGTEDKTNLEVKKVYIPNKEYLSKDKECLDLIKTKHGYILTETFGTSYKAEDLDGLYERLCEIFGEDKGRKGSNYKRIDEIELSENDKGKVSGLLEHSDSSIDLEIFAMQEVKIIKSANEIDFKKRIDIYRDIQGKKKEITDKAAEPAEKTEKGAAVEEKAKDKPKPEVKKVYIPNEEYLSKDIECLDLIETKYGYILTETFGTSCKEEDLEGLYKKLGEVFGKDKGCKESNYKKIDEIGLSKGDKEKVSTLLQHSNSSIELGEFAMQEVEIIKANGTTEPKTRMAIYKEIQFKENATKATTVAEEKKTKASDNEGQRNTKTTETVTETARKPEKRVAVEEKVKTDEEMKHRGERAKDKTKLEVKKVYIPNKEYLSKDEKCLELIKASYGYILTEKFEDSCEEKDLESLYKRLAEILGKDKGGEKSNYKKIDEIELPEGDKKKVSNLLERSESIIELMDFVFQNIKIIKPSGVEFKKIIDIYYMQSQKERNVTKATTVAEEKKKEEVKEVKDPQGGKGQGKGMQAAESVKKPEVSATGTTSKPTETAASEQGTVKPGWGKAGEDAQERGARMFGELKGRRQVNTGRNENRKGNIDSKDDKGQEINETAQEPQVDAKGVSETGKVREKISELNDTEDAQKMVDGLREFSGKMMKKSKMFNEDNEDNAAEIRASVSHIKSHFKKHLKAGSIYKLKVDSKVVYVDVNHTSSGELREISDNKVTEIEQDLKKRDSESYEYMDDNRVRTFLKDRGFNKKRIGRAIRKYLLGEREAFVNFKNGNMAVHVDMDEGIIEDGIISLPEYKTKRVKNYRDLYGEVGKPELKLKISEKLKLNVYIKSIDDYCIYTPEGRELEASLKNKVYIDNDDRNERGYNIIFLIDEDYKNGEIKECEIIGDDMFDIVNTADRIGEKKFRKIISKASNKDKIDGFLK